MFIIGADFRVVEKFPRGREDVEDYSRTEHPSKSNKNKNIEKLSF